MDMAEETNNQAKSLKDELFHDLHEQFAINQNKHLEIFFGLVGSFVALFGALGYTYAHREFNLPNQGMVSSCANLSQLSVNLKDLPYTTATLFGAIFITNLLFMLMILLVTNLGWNFRRDQALNNKIRECSLSYDEYKSFFLSSGYGQETGCMPGLYEIVFMFGLLCQLFLYLFTVYIISVSTNCGDGSLLGMALLIFLMPVAPFIECLYYYKRSIKLFFSR